MTDQEPGPGDLADVLFAAYLEGMQDTGVVSGVAELQLAHHAAYKLGRVAALVVQLDSAAEQFAAAGVLSDLVRVHLLADLRRLRSAAALRLARDHGGNVAATQRVLTAVRPVAYRTVRELIEYALKIESDEGETMDKSVYVVLQPHSKTNSSDRHQVVEFRSWMRHVNSGGRESLPIAGSFATASEAAEVRDNLNSGQRD